MNCKLQAEKPLRLSASLRANFKFINTDTPEEVKSMDFTNRDSVRQLIKENDITDIAQLNAMLKQISGVFIEELLEAERDAHLGYDRYEQTGKPKKNSRQKCRLRLHFWLFAKTSSLSSWSG
jgi:hypothetical protein